MRWIVGGIGAVYLVGFILFFWMNLTVGPVTPALALLRAVVWPVSLIMRQPWPRGERARIIGEEN